ncbi:MAG: heparinase II/III family protein [Litorimonas sp.]
MSQRIPLWSPYVSLVKARLQPILMRSSGRASFNGRIAAFHPAAPSFKFGNSENAENLLKGQFILGHQSLDVGLQGDPWTVAVPSIEFAQWLHGFDWLQDLLSPKKNAPVTRAMNYVDSWILTYGKWNDFSWQTDIIARRLFNWLTLWSPTFAKSDESDVGRRRRNVVYRQLKALKANYKYTEAGLSRLRAAAALAMGGAKLTEKADGFLSRGLDLLDTEIELQILPDGGHVSRSPEQALEALKILLALDTLLQDRGVEGSTFMSRAIDRLTPVVAFFRHSDGALAGFHGGSEGQKPLIDTLLNAAPGTPKPFSYCPHTGYQRIERGSSILMVDTGSTPAWPFDVRTHMAPLAFELSTAAGRMIVNCGWNDTQPKAWKRPVRSAAAHNTLTLDNQSSGKLLPDGWKTRALGQAVLVEAGPVKAQRKEQSSGVWLEMSHDGYRAKYGLGHRRRFFVDNGGGDIRGEDSLYVPLGAQPVRRDEIPFDIRFHFHPDVRVSLSQDQQSALLVIGGTSGWRFRTDGGLMRVEGSVYLGKGHKPVKSQQLVISGKAYGDGDGESRSNRVRWSLRELKARAS